MSTLYVVEKFYEGRYEWRLGKKRADEWRPVSNLRPRAEKSRAEEDMKLYKAKHGKHGYWQADFKFRVSTYKRAAATKKATKKKKAKAKR